MTLVLILDLDIVKMYMYTMKFLALMIQQLSTEQPDA